MSNREKFERDLTFLLSRLTVDVTPEVENKLNMLKEWLLKLHKAKCCKNQPHCYGTCMCQIPNPKKLRNPTRIPSK